MELATNDPALIALADITPSLQINQFVTGGNFIIDTMFLNIGGDTTFNAITGIANIVIQVLQSNIIPTNTVGGQYPDSRIVSTDGTASALNGSLALTSGSIYISSGDSTNISDTSTNTSRTFAGRSI